MPLIDPDELAEKELLPGWRGRFFHTEHMTFAYYDFAQGSSIHEHRHENEEVWNVVDGELQITYDGRPYIVGAGSAVTVPPDVPHGVLALTDGKAIVVDHPRRTRVAGVDL